MTNKKKSNNAKRVCVVLAVTLLAGCASTPNREDPFEPFNRKMWAFNDSLDRAVLEPASKVYRKITPDPVEKGIANFFNNLGYPYIIANNFLQGRFKDGFQDVGNFVVNTTIGIGGLFDAAGAAGYKRLDQNFGATVGVWGLPQGPFLMLPFFGPTTLAGLGGVPMNWYLYPVNYASSGTVQAAGWGLDTVSRRAATRQEIQQVRQALDPYAFLRSAYLQHQNYLISGGEVSGEQFLKELGIDEQPGDQGAPAPK